MRYREVVIDGRVFLEIVDDEPQHPEPPTTSDEDDEDAPSPSDKGKVWIGELVPFR